MVSTRSNRANEPLKRLETPPKRTRKDPKSSTLIPKAEESLSTPVAGLDLRKDVLTSKKPNNESKALQNHSQPEDIPSVPSTAVAAEPRSSHIVYADACTQTDPVIILTATAAQSSSITLHLENTSETVSTSPRRPHKVAHVVEIVDEDDDNNEDEEDEEPTIEPATAPTTTPTQPKHSRPRPQTEPRRTVAPLAGASNTNNKRARGASFEDDDSAEPQRKRRLNVANTSLSTTQDDPFWMFDKKSESDDDSPARPQPKPRTWAERIKKERRDRERKKRLAALAATPPRSAARQSTFYHHGLPPLPNPPLNNPELSAPTASPALEQPAVTSNSGTHGREERSAAPEPETPKRSFLGSLRSIGSATVGRLFAASPAKGVEITTDTTPSPQPLPAPPPPPPQQQPPVQAGSYVSGPLIQYPSIENLAEQPPEKATDKTPTRLQSAKQSNYTPAVPATEPAPRHRKPHTLTAAEKDFYSARKQRRQNLFTSNPENPTESISIFGVPRPPLFGPNSLYAQGKSPKEHISPFSPSVYLAKKRRLDEMNAQNEAEASDPLPSARSNPFSPDVMDEDEDDMTQSSRENSNELNTPAAKRQKTQDTLPQTPRSAMKKAATIGASVGRSVKSVNFKSNPVSGYKTISPVMGRDSVLEYKHRPGMLFSLQSDIDAYEQEVAQQQAASPNPSLDNSPNTQANTDLNRFSTLKPHPGSVLTDAINEKTGGKGIEFVWSDPNNPDWKPSLGNPSPGTFSCEFLDQMDDEGNIIIPDLEINEEDETVSPIKKPVQPQTPRLSHAELPKPATSTTTSQTDSVNDTAQRNLAKAREHAEKFKPRSHSRLSNVTAARSRSPSPPTDDPTQPPGFVTDDGASISGASDDPRTPPPFETRVFRTETGITSIIDPADATLPKAEWTWNEATEEHISNHPSYPDFKANRWGELVPSMTLKTPSGDRDNTVVGPDNMTSKTRDEIRMAQAMKIDFHFDPPQTYEEAGTGSSYIVQLINKVEAANPNAMKNEAWDREWTEHENAIADAARQGKRLIATYGSEEEEEL